MAQSENVRCVAEQILAPFEAGTVPAACAQIFIRHTPDDSRPCARWSWRNQLLAALRAPGFPPYELRAPRRLGSRDRLGRCPGSRRRLCHGAEPRAWQHRSSLGNGQQRRGRRPL